MSTVYTTGALYSHKDEAAAVTVGLALSNGNTVLKLRNIKSSFFVAVVSFVAACCHVCSVDGTAFHDGKTHLPK